MKCLSGLVGEDNMKDVVQMFCIKCYPPFNVQTNCLDVSNTYGCVSRPVPRPSRQDTAHAEGENCSRSYSERATRRKQSRRRNALHFRVLDIAAEILIPQFNLSTEHPYFKRFFQIFVRASNIQKRPLPWQQGCMLFSCARYPM